MVKPILFDEHLRKAYHRIDLRILPFLSICYLFNYLDRINIGFAKLQMQSDLVFSDAAYGLGAGIFFLGYVLFEVPSNLLLAKIGARKILSCLLILWGVVSVLMLCVRDINTFYSLRFLLGVFEAGFAPGMLLYLTYWYSDRHIARAIAIVLCAAPIGGMIGGPVSAWIMITYAGTKGLAGWQWMFLLEGLPAILLGVVAFYYLVDKPEEAKWLSKLEKAAVAIDVERNQNRLEQSFRKILCNPRIYGYAMTNFCLICGLYLVGFWLPTILNEAGITDLREIGVYSAIPYTAAVIAMYFLSRSSDRHNERRWHSSITLIIGTIALLVAIYAESSFAITLTSITIATALIFAAYSVFWAIPITYLKGNNVAGGIAFVNSIGLIGGFFSPTIIGWMKTTIGNLQSGLMIIVSFLIIGSVLMILNHPRSKTISIGT